MLIEELKANLIKDGIRIVNDKCYRRCSNEAFFQCECDRKLIQELLEHSDELKSDVLIIDERKGRKVAQKMGITITGTIGILLQAHNEKMISTNEIKFCW